MDTGRTDQVVFRSNLSPQGLTTLKPWNLESTRDLERDMDVIPEVYMPRRTRIYLIELWNRTESGLSMD